MISIKLLCMNCSEITVQHNNFPLFFPKFYFALLSTKQLRQDNKIWLVSIQTML